MRFINSKQNFDGEFTFHGDKSITHRAIMLNGVARGVAILKNPSLGEDCLATCRAMEKLGAKIEKTADGLKITGALTLNDNQELDCGNSATTLRLLTGLLAGFGVNAKLYGDKSLSNRPMERVAEPLRVLGAKIQTTNAKSPVFVEKSRIIGGKIALKVPSAQVKSAILLAGLGGDKETVVTEEVPTRDHTERMLEVMGAKIIRSNGKISISKSELTATDMEVPADISSASYFMALGALKGRALCKNLCVNPTRTGILKAFDKFGVQYSVLNKRIVCGEEVADILVKKSILSPVRITKTEVPSMIDELPLIAMLCSFAKGESVISGAQELKYKECDRILATAELINSLGGVCIPTTDGFIVEGFGGLDGGAVESYGDHRIAMTGAIALLASKNGGELYGDKHCAISFPDFFEKLGV